MGDSAVTDTLDPPDQARLVVVGPPTPVLEDEQEHDGNDQHGRRFTVVPVEIEVGYFAP
jgi:hypothetical protein